MLLVFSASFNLSTKISSCVLCFFLVVINLSFLPAIVVEKSVSFNFEKEKHPWNTLCNSRKPFFFQNVVGLSFYFVALYMNPGITDITTNSLMILSNWFFIYFTWKLYWHCYCLL